MTCDQFEFDPPDSEQSLDLAIATTSRHWPDLQSVLRACGASGHQRPLPKPDWPHWPMIAEHLARFGALKLPRPTELREIVLLCDDWNDIEIGLAFGPSLVWYHWTTSA